MSEQQTIILRLFNSFEALCFCLDGREVWRAREILTGLGYAKWQNFREAVRRAWESCNSSGENPQLHFFTTDGAGSWVPDEVLTDASKNPKGGAPGEDVILTRLGAYLVAMNGDPRKPEIGFAQHYFAAATRTLDTWKTTERCAPV